MNFNVTLGSSLPAGAIGALDNHCGVTSPSHVPLAVAMFMIGYIFGPIILSPMSETFGRCPAFLSSFAIYTAFKLGCAQAPNWPTLLFRFLTGCGASAPKMVTGKTFVNLVHVVIAFPMLSALNDDDI
jgi:MFS family permease